MGRIAVETHGVRQLQTTLSELSCCRGSPAVQLDVPEDPREPLSDGLLLHVLHARFDEHGQPRGRAGLLPQSHSGPAGAAPVAGEQASVLQSTGAARNDAGVCRIHQELCVG